MPGLTEKLLLCLALAAVAVGCKPQVGDDCKVSTDCSAAGDRLCDITAPGGYCTVFNCEPNSCPEDESLCVQFGAVRSPLCADLPEASPSPYARTFCMATCDDGGDCRSGYICADLSDPNNDWGAVLIDTNRGNKACVVPFTQAGVDKNASDAVCKTDATGGSSAPGGEAEQGGGEGGGGG